MTNQEIIEFVKRYGETREWSANTFKIYLITLNTLIKTTGKEITEFDGEYEISSLGRVRSVNNNCIMQPSINVSGKPQVNFRFNKKGKTRTIESLLLKEF